MKTVPSDTIDQVTNVLYEVDNLDTAPSNLQRTVDYLLDAVGNRTSVPFVYDARNRCVKRNVNGVPTFFYWDNWDLIEERNGLDQQIARYVHGAMMDEILVRITADPPIYYHQDSIGSVTHLTDGNGNVVEKYTYDIFGAPTILDPQSSILSASAFGNRFLFTGREYISEIGLYDYRNRVYSPEWGRFLQTDSLRFDAGDYNLYRYCANNPINRIHYHPIADKIKGFPFLSQRGAGC